ncbi:MAG: hypothetical protein CMK09_06120 [Ponticaulis sp.]|nr:hypothetical protein [Ponticaulis sp.]
MKSYLVIAALAGAAVLSACTTENIRTPTSASIGTQVTTNEAGEEIICKREYATGSRVKFTEICGTEQEWSRIEDANREALRDATGDRAFTTQ